MTNLLRTRALRLPLVLLIAAAWFGVSNHCALGALQHASAMQIPKCHATAPENPAPAKHDQKSGVECCKILRAVASVPAKSWARDETKLSDADAYRGEHALAIVQSQTTLVPLFLDTGPPDAHSFAELILQRSLLAHAPPPLA